MFSFWKTKWCYVCCSSRKRARSQLAHQWHRDIYREWIWSKAHSPQPCHYKIADWYIMGGHHRSLFARTISYVLHILFFCLLICSHTILLPKISVRRNRLNASAPPIVQMRSFLEYFEVCCCSPIPSLFRSYSPSWLTTSHPQSKRFFESFAKQNGFDPLTPENWYNVSTTKLIATEVLFLVLQAFSSQFTLQNL